MIALARAETTTFGVYDALARAVERAQMAGLINDEEYETVEPVLDAARQRADAAMPAEADARAAHYASEEIGRYRRDRLLDEPRRASR